MQLSSFPCMDPALSPWPDHPNNFFQGAQITKFFITQFSTFSFFFLPLTSQYYPQVAVHRHTSAHVLPLSTHAYNIKTRCKVQKPRLLVRDSYEFAYPADSLCISIFVYTNVLLYKGKVIFSLLLIKRHIIKTYEAWKCTPRNLNLGTRCRRGLVEIFTFRQPYS